MRILSNTQSAILSSIEIHGKCNLKGVYHLFPHLSKNQIGGALADLQESGWLKVNKSQTIDGVRKHISCVMRTKKNLYTQPELF